jgi:hypothetical protein
MKLKEIYVDDSKPFGDQRLWYRVSLTIDEEKVLLKREHFRSGFYSGEQDDHFYFNTDYPQSNGDFFRYCSFMTSKLDDEEYLKRKEEELIKLFYDKCNKNITISQERLRKEEIKYNKRIDNYKDIINHFEYCKRGDKIKKIKSNL